MGLRDRDYTQQNFGKNKKRRQRRTDGRSVVVSIIFINFILWFANGLFFPGDPKDLEIGDDLTKLLLLDSGNWWYLYSFLTYGFTHDPSRIWHIGGNMFALMMFGYGLMLGIGPNGFGFVRSDNIESTLGRREFTAFYLLTIIIGGIVYMITNMRAEYAATLGASGGVCGVVILYAWLFPRKVLMVWGILPMPMWMIGVVIVIMDALGAAGLGCGVAFSVHLAGAACGTLYYFLFLLKRRQLTAWLDASSRPRKRKPKVWLESDEPNVTPKSPDDEFNRRLDEVLQRYGEVGEAGLTAEERDFLHQASQRFSTGTTR